MASTAGGKVTPINAKAEEITPTEALLKAKQDMMGDLLSGAMINGRYAPGYFDKMLADKYGLGLDHVKAKREEFFGKLKEPDEVAELRGLIDDLTSQLGQLRSRFDTTVTRNGWKA